MASQIIYECQAFCPTLDRAKRRVPEEFIPCYDWFQQNTGEMISRLPHRMENRPKTPIPLSRDAGIYIPGTSLVSYKRGRKYALSVHSSGSGLYNDRKPIHLADGTWVLDYAAHSGSDSSQNYNGSLMNCLTDGVPVGVMVREATGYRILGLAFVERFNSATNMFTLHGPITDKSESEGAFAFPGFDDLTDDERSVLAEIDDTDERKLVKAEQVRREQQDAFRKSLLNAYEGACAITETDVPQVLQAAHINPYRGRKSQVVNNGILLRSEMHLLYDAHLVSIAPDTLKISLSDRLRGTTYATLTSSHLRLPRNEASHPNRNLLAAHYEQFMQENHVLVA